MQWRSVGERGKPYPDFIRKLSGKTGVYAIRQRGWVFTTVLYVGEAHKGSLYKTLTRHFQSWKRSKQWWRGQFAPEQTDPGHTYARAPSLEVAVEVTTPARAIEKQREWIRSLKPRDNIALVEELEEAPF